MRTRRNAPPAPEAPPVPAPRGVRLRSSENVRAELARTYRAFTLGQIDSPTAKTRGFLLQTLAGVIRDQLEAERLSALEEQIAQLVAVTK